MAFRVEKRIFRIKWGFSRLRLRLSSKFFFFYSKILRCESPCLESRTADFLHVRSPDDVTNYTKIYGRFGSKSIIGISRKRGFVYRNILSRVSSERNMLYENFKRHFVE